VVASLTGRFTAEQGFSEPARVYRIYASFGLGNYICKITPAVEMGRVTLPASDKMGAGSLSRGHCGKGVALATNTRLAPRLKKE
jgi:hypothetical protein